MLCTDYYQSLLEPRLLTKSMKHNLLTTVYITFFTEINECVSDPCLNGQCTDQISGYMCTCTAGYTGSICETGMFYIAVQNTDSITELYYCCKCSTWLRLQVLLDIQSNDKMMFHKKVRVLYLSTQLLQTLPLAKF